MTDLNNSTTRVVVDAQTWNFICVGQFVMMTFKLNKHTPTTIHYVMIKNKQILVVVNKKLANIFY